MCFTVRVRIGVRVKVGLKVAVRVKVGLMVAVRTSLSASTNLVSDSLMAWRTVSLLEARSCPRPYG